MGLQPLASDGRLPPAVLRIVLNFILQYGTAAHLAILTAAPLFLSSMCGEGFQAVALLWLSLLAAVWIIMDPSPRWGELPRDARRRIVLEIALDPLLFVFVSAIVLAAVRAVNGGLEVSYSASRGIWAIEGPLIASLPGSVSGAGFLPFAGTVALAVVTLGVRHALGTHARLAFLFLSAIFAALTVVLWLTVGPVSDEGVFARHASNPFFAGSSLVVFLAFAVVVWTELWRYGGVILELLVALAVGALTSGLLVSAPAVALWIAVPLAVALLATGSWAHGRSRSATGWLITALAFTVACVPEFVLCLGRHPELSQPWPPIADDFLAVREAASRIAFDGWHADFWLGKGLGAYPLVLGFLATPSDWLVLGDAQRAAPNGFAQFLFERGALGAVVVLAVIVCLVANTVLRFIRAGRHWTFSSIHPLGVAALLAVLALTFFESTFTQPAMLLPVGAALAVSAAAMPDATEEESYG